MKLKIRETFANEGVSIPKIYGTGYEMIHNRICAIILNGHKTARCDFPGAPPK